MDANQTSTIKVDRGPGGAVDQGDVASGFKWWFLLFWISKWRRHYTIERETSAAVDLGGEG